MRWGDPREVPTQKDLCAVASKREPSFRALRPRRGREGRAGPERTRAASGNLGPMLEGNCWEVFVGK
eukprot:7143149-Pyramimonas_sp.AAC.1